MSLLIKSGAASPVEPNKYIVTVGTSGADYDNFDDAIDYLRTINGGEIVVTSDITITSTAVKDISNIHIISNGAYSQTRHINKTVTGGYWHGRNVKMENLWFWRLQDSANGGNNEIFRFTENITEIKLRWVMCLGMGSDPPVFNCQGYEVHIDGEHSQLGHVDMGYEAFSNYSGLCLHLYDGCQVHLTGNLDVIYRDATCEITGSPAVATSHTLKDLSSRVDNDSSVAGDTVKDALETLAP